MKSGKPLGDKISSLSTQYASAQKDVTDKQKQIEQLQQPLKKMKNSFNH